jgi:hypothetical protein
MYSSLVVDQAGAPRISYYNGYQGTLVYARSSAGTWHIELLDTAHSVGTYTSLALDKSGQSHIRQHVRSDTTQHENVLGLSCG